MFSRVGCRRSSRCRSQRPATARAIAASTPVVSVHLALDAEHAGVRRVRPNVHRAHAVDRQQRLSKGRRLRSHPEDDLVGLLHGVLQAGRRVDGEEPAVVDDGHAAADQRRLGEDVRAEQDGVVGPEGADHLARLLDLARIEAGSGLVEEQHLRRSEERLGQAETLPIALRELEDLVVEHGLQTAGRGDAFDLSGDGARAAPPSPWPRIAGRRRRRARRRAAGARAGSRSAGRRPRSRWPCHGRPPSRGRRWRR